MGLKEEMGKAAKESFADLTRPAQGWLHLVRNVSKTWQDSALLGSFQRDAPYLSMKALLDPELILGMPTSISKYVSAFVSSEPTTTLVFLVWFLSAGYVGGESDSEGIALEVIGLGGLNFFFVARILMKVFLEERNKFLAKNILEQCRLYQEAGSPLTRQGKPVDVVYVPEVAGIDSNEEGGKTIVAILGMAHCNGIMKLLTEGRID